MPSILGRVWWNVLVLGSRWKNRLSYLPAVPRVYRNWWRLPAAKWGRSPVTLELRNGLKYTVRPRTHDLGVINEAVILDPYLRPGYVRLEADSIVMDVGANIGDFAVRAARLCPLGTVYAIEPIAEHCRIIHRQIELNGVSNVRVLPVAVGKELGELELTVNGGHSSACWGDPVQSRTRVGMVTLEALLDREGIERVDLLKMDCEGAEWEIFPASEGVLPRITQICMEYHNGRLRAEWLERWLHERGYVVHRTYGPWCGLLWASRLKGTR